MLLTAPRPVDLALATPRNGALIQSAPHAHKIIFLCSAWYHQKTVILSGVPRAELKSLPGEGTCGCFYSTRIGGRLKLPGERKPASKQRSTQT
jgi:hypothetical protein